ncbi:MAG: ATP synthase F0 subunit B [Candidatus Binataceae bacterium]|jgi:F-type H+-transporting ATPase subunit b
MKSRIAIAAALLGAALTPTLAIAAEGGGEERGSWGALLFYVINFLLFAAILWKYALPAARNFFRDRALGIRDTWSKAEAALRGAQELANRAAERMARLEAEKNQIASDLADETVFQIGRIYDLAQEAAARIKRDAELGAAAMGENAQRRVREALAHAAGSLARELVANNFQPGDQTRLLQGFVEKLGEEAGR